MNRLFIAIELDQKTKDGVCALIDDLKKELPDERFVTCDKIHITLLFLGNTKIPVEKILEVLKGLKFHTSIELSGLDAFYDGKYPRVLFVKVVTDLKEVHDRICDELGIKDERFSPHITLSRLKRTQDLGKTIESHSNFKANFEAEHAYLFNSNFREYTKLGPSYGS